MPDLRPAAVKLLEDSAREFVGRADRIRLDAWDRVPPSGGWSPLQLAEHLALVELSCVKALPRKLFAEPAGEELLAATRPREEGLVTWFETGKKRVAPDFVTPTNQWSSAAEVMAAFTSHRASNVETFQNGPEDLRAYAFAHPILGPLDGYQWAVFLAEHVRRHLRQLDQILIGLGITTMENPTGRT